MTLSYLGDILLTRPLVSHHCPGHIPKRSFEKLGKTKEGKIVIGSCRLRKHR